MFMGWIHKGIKFTPVFRQVPGLLHWPVKTILPFSFSMAPLCTQLTQFPTDVTRQSTLDMYAHGEWWPMVYIYNISSYDFIQNFVLCTHVLWLKLWLCSAHHWLVWFRMGFWWLSSFNKAISPGASNVITTNVTLNMFVQFICMFLCASDCWLS